MFDGLDVRKLFWIFIAIMLVRGMISFSDADLISTLLTLPGQSRGKR